jgi:hypothetical protein
MLDVAVAYNRYRFLGNEFLTWLWYMIENKPDELRSLNQDLTSLEIGNRMVLENHHNDSDENITIKGDNAGLEEGLLALSKGALVAEINLVYRSGEQKWQFNIKGESLNISGLKTPETPRPETKEDVEGYVLEKIYLLDRVIQFIENLFKMFVRLRLSNQWNGSILQVQTWIASTT